MSDSNVDPFCIGKHCEIKSCGQLDFLPIQCTFCNLVFCKDHHSPYRHECDKVPEKEHVAASDFTPAQSCHLCNHADVVNVVCEECDKTCCMSHRTLEQHSCPSLTKQTTNKPPNPIPLTSSSVKGVKLKRKGAKSLALERKVMVMKMKNKSCGPSSIPVEERIFINVALEDCKEPCYYHFSSSWSIGRCVDQLSGYLKMRNNNDKAGADVLSMVYNGHVLPMSELITKHTESGDTVILKYIPS